MNEVYLLTGGNIGDRKGYLQQAANAVAQRCGPVVQASALFETEAWGNTAQASFYNQCLLIHTPLSAADLLQNLLQIENELGRVRSVKYGPRTIDIDILFFNNDIIDQPGLHIPHPQLPNRRFVLECLNDLAPNKIHPQLQLPVHTLLARCTDPLAVYKLI